MPEQQCRVARRCLCLGDITSESSDDFGRFLSDDPCAPRRGADMEMLSFRRGDPRDIWERLQYALNGRPDGFGDTVIAARGTGCVAALALSEQLPVERIALVCPVLAPAPPRRDMPADEAAARRVARRMARFAVRNLSLCAADMLVVGRGDAAFERATRPAALWTRSRLIRMRAGEEWGEIMLNNRENMVKRAITAFLRGGELPKPLAQSAEMCIIYG